MLSTIPVFACLQLRVYVAKQDKQEYQVGSSVCLMQPFYCLTMNVSTLQEGAEGEIAALPHLNELLCEPAVERTKQKHTSTQQKSVGSRHFGSFNLYVQTSRDTI